MPLWNNPNEDRNAHLMPPSAHAQYGYAPSNSTPYGPDMYQPTTYHVLATPLHDRLGRTQERKRNPTLKGVFTKDLKSLMYGFGDDFYGTPESVSVMEDILIEFITNVASTSLSLHTTPTNYCSVIPQRVPVRRAACKLKISVASSPDHPTTRSWPVWRSFSSCRRTSSEPARHSRTTGFPNLLNPIPLLRFDHSSASSLSSAFCAVPASSVAA